MAAWYVLRGKAPPAAGEGPAGPAVGVDSFQRVWSTDKMVLIGLGDRITAGFGATPKHSYFELLVENDDSRYADMKGRDLRHVLPNLEVKNHLVSYTVSEEHLTHQLPKIEKLPADVRGIVVVTTGGNDLIHDYGRSRRATARCTAAPTSRRSSGRRTSVLGSRESSTELGRSSPAAARSSWPTFTMRFGGCFARDEQDFWARPLMRVRLA